MGKGPAQRAGLPLEVTDQLNLRLDKPQKKTPERRCIVTGESLARNNTHSPLLRFVAAPDGVLVFDAAEKLPGRGCYVTADPTLLQHAIDKKLFARALKGKVTIPADLPDSVASQLTARVLASLGLAKKSGALAIGEEAVDQSLAVGTAVLALTALDASARTAADLAAKAARHQISYIALSCDAAQLGPALGRDNAVYLTILGANGGNSLAGALTRDCARLAPFVKRPVQKVEM